MSQHKIEPQIISAVVARNGRQSNLIVDAVVRATSGQLRPVVALWGVAFKANTDDVRESPSLKIARLLLDRAYEVRAADPVVSQEQVDAVLGAGRLPLADSETAAATGADVVILATEWRQYRSPDFEALRSVMRGTTLIDGRNQWSHRQVRAAGLQYIGIGRS
jgi:UDPglucose 6-dehydrogenase